MHFPAQQRYSPGKDRPPPPPSIILWMTDLPESTNSSSSSYGTRSPFCVILQVSFSGRKKCPSAVRSLQSAPESRKLPLKGPVCSPPPPSLLSKHNWFCRSRGRRVGSMCCVALRRDGTTHGQGVRSLNRKKRDRNTKKQEFLKLDRKKYPN